MGPAGAGPRTWSMKERYMSDPNPLKAIIRESIAVDVYEEQTWEGSFDDYLALIHKNPSLVRNAFQRLYDMILGYGFREVKRLRERVTHYNFFEDTLTDGRDAIFGLDKALDRLVGILKSAAHHFGPEKRVLLLHGPVGSSKSTIVRLIKSGVEKYSKSTEGALYSYSWETEKGVWEPCPMHEEPLHLVPMDARTKIVHELNKNFDREYSLRVTGEMCPFCRTYFNEYMERYGGDWSKVIEHVKVGRLILSEKDRVGIGTFQPKDEKNQDSTELTGDINYRKIALYGSDSDPRAFNFDGEFNIANRGVVEFIEVLKLDVAFLYDLLGASQEHSIKPKKFAQTDIDEVIIGHTNEPEFRRLQSNELMEAFRDRTMKIDIPYNSVLREEVKIYQKDYNADTVKKHIAPHTLEMAAMWAVITRLEDPKKADLTILQKLKLYNGKTVPGYSEDNVRELRLEAKREGMFGISPRYIQDKISNALVEGEKDCVNPFMVINELEKGLYHHSLITSEEVRQRYVELLAVVKQEYEDIVKNEVQKAISADPERIRKLCSNYVDNLRAYTLKEKVRDPFTGKDVDPDERLMRSIEERIGITDNRKDDFRREIMNYIAALAIEKKTFDYTMNERLHRALELKLFEDEKDTIKLKALVSSVVDRRDQEKIDVIKTRLIGDYGYCNVCATDMLNYVASLFARGDPKEE
jgi:serine protein kinase